MGTKTKGFIYKEFIQRENLVERAGFIPEMKFYESIKNGDIKAVEALYSEPINEKRGLGVLSKNPITNLKYQVVIAAAMIARSCIEGGMEVSLAYLLSDYYIAELDNLNDIEDINNLHIDLCLDYAKRMKELNNKEIYSRHILKCVDYIYEHLHKRITVEELAAYLGISQEYLSRLFKLEIGIPVSKYIMKRKIETAANMLAYSDYEISMISETLAFANQSYFSSIFKKEMGTTPLRYRNIHKHDFMSSSKK